MGHAHRKSVAPESFNVNSKDAGAFSGLATIVHNVLTHYLNLEKFLNQTDSDLKTILAEAPKSPPHDTENPKGLVIY